MVEILTDNLDGLEEDNLFPDVEETQSQPDTEDTTESPVKQPKKKIVKGGYSPYISGGRGSNKENWERHVRPEDKQAVQNDPFLRSILNGIKD